MNPCPCCDPLAVGPIDVSVTLGLSWRQLCDDCLRPVVRMSACHHQLAREAARPGQGRIVLPWQSVVSRRTDGAAA
jgi:hypothetical protein